MVNRQGTAHSARRRLGWKLMTGVAIASLAAGCTKLGKKDSPQRRIAAIDYSKQADRQPLKPNHPLHVATTKWAHKHQKDPADANAALNYARNLKAIGAKDKALGVLARAYQLNPRNGELASEYGRLALDLGKTQLAEQLLDRAMRGRGKSDWRVLSAMGTVNAKRGDYKKAQSYYVAALGQQPGATSVYNNLALSYALDGKAGDAEKLLKEAVGKGHNTPVVRQNLALVLNLQSKFDEAQKVARSDLDTGKINSNVSFMRNMVKTTRIARAGPERTPVRKADPVTTASLPKDKKKNAATTAVAAATLPNRKPERPVAAASASQGHGKPAETLPWRKKPAKKTEHATQVAGLQEKMAKAPSSPPSGAVTNWSMTIDEAAGASQTGAAPTRTASKTETFNFPAPR